VNRAVDLGIPEHAHPAWLTLQQHLRHARQTPCAGPAGDDWTGSPAAQRRAAHACLECPVMDACAAYADTAAEQHGTWGGITAADRAHRREATT
jgi:hypothetical protein